MVPPKKEYDGVPVVSSKSCGLVRQVPVEAEQCLMAVDICVH